MGNCFPTKLCYTCSRPAELQLHAGSPWLTKETKNHRVCIKCLNILLHVTDYGTILMCPICRKPTDYGGMRTTFCSKEIQANRVELLSKMDRRYRK